MVVVNNVSQDSFENEIGAGCQVCGDLGRCSAAIGAQEDREFCHIYCCVFIIMFCFLSIGIGCG